VKRNGRDEPIRVFTYTCLLTTQGNSLYLKLAKTSCFSFYLLKEQVLLVDVGECGMGRWQGKE
jgi:hypothetical protein